MFTSFLLYCLQMIGLTLGVIVICGLAVRLFSRAFAHISGTGSGDIFDITSLIGTPVHELGHALMCLLFGHKIKRIQLWSPTHTNGVYGFVEHSYNRKNPWARLGSLFIGVGPIFSGLAVTILALYFCFPTQWSNYLASSRQLLVGAPSLEQILIEIGSLLWSMLTGFSESWWRSLIGILIILSVSLHITLSWQDIKSAVGALPIYLLLILGFCAITSAIGISKAVISTLALWNLYAASLFCIVIAFSAVWVALAVLLKCIRIFISWF